MRAALCRERTDKLRRVWDTIRMGVPLASAPSVSRPGTDGGGFIGAAFPSIVRCPVEETSRFLIQRRLLLEIQRKPEEGIDARALRSRPSTTPYLLKNFLVQRKRLNSFGCSAHHRILDYKESY